MYKHKNMIIWEIVNKTHPLILPYLSSDVKTLTLGAGIWEFIGNNTLINKTYVDDEVNMPYGFIRNIKIKNIVNIFNDILNFKIENKEKIN